MLLEAPSDWRSWLTEQIFASVANVDKDDILPVNVLLFDCLKERLLDEEVNLAILASQHILWAFLLILLIVVDQIHYRKSQLNKLNERNFTTFTWLIVVGTVVQSQLTEVEFCWVWLTMVECGEMLQKLLKRLEAG